MLFRQFAVTGTSAAMVISAINALTLSPPCVLLLLRPGQPIGIMARITRGIDGVGEGYGRVVRRLVKPDREPGGTVAVGAISYVVFLRTPSGFLPEEDKGFLITVVSLPPGASLNRTSIAAAKAEEILHKEPAVDGVTAVLGYDFLSGGSASNSGVIFVRLKGYDQRSSPSMHSTAVARRLFGALSTIPDGTIIALNPPAISGLGQVGGFEYMLEALQGQEPAAMAAAMRGLVVAANQRPSSRVFSTFEAETPQVRSTSTVTRRARSASTSPTCSRHCRLRSAATTSTTSTSTAACGRSGCRPSSNTAPRSTTSPRST